MRNSSLRFSNNVRNTRRSVLYTVRTQFDRPLTVPNDRPDRRRSKQSTPRLFFLPILYPKCFPARIFPYPTLAFSACPRVVAVRGSSLCRLSAGFLIVSGYPTSAYPTSWLSDILAIRRSPAVPVRASSAAHALSAFRSVSDLAIRRLAIRQRGYPTSAYPTPLAFRRPGPTAHCAHSTGN